MKIEIEALQACIRDKTAVIQNLTTTVDGLHKQLRRQAVVEREETTTDFIKEVVQRKTASRQRGLMPGKENSLLALPLKAAGGEL